MQKHIPHNMSEQDPEELKAFLNSLENLSTEDLITIRDRVASLIETRYREMLQGLREKMEQ